MAIIKSLRVRLGNALLGAKQKDYIPPLTPFDGMSDLGGLNQYTSKWEQISANIGWSYAANTAIADPCAAVKIQLFRRKSDGDREEITEHEILDLIDNPNAVHTGEQLRQLHHTYMNFVGEGYIHMIADAGEDFIPSKGKLPGALEVFPAHLVQFRLGDTYSKSTVKYKQVEYPLASVIRDINPDPNDPFKGRSVIAASAAAIDLEEQMKDWDRQLFINGAHPSLVFTANEAMQDDAYKRWEQQFTDKHAGVTNAHKPLLIEGGDVKTLMFSQQDLEFLESRKWSRDEILAMWRVSPGMLGSVENVNRSNLDAGFYIHALINTVPRVRQFVKQLNTSLVKVYDPMLELDYVNPVPEDAEAKLAEAKAGVNTWRTIDETRDSYGEKPLPNHQGEQMIILSRGGAQTLESVLEGPPPPIPPEPIDPLDDPDDAEAADQPDKADPKKSLAGVKKKPSMTDRK